MWLDHNVHLVKRFDILHGGKGLCLDIAAEEEFEFYMILYKATLSLPYRQETSPFMKGSTPFQYQYAFTPSYPLSLFTIVEQMSNEWQRSNDLEKLHVKTLFYQFVYELSQQLHAQGIEPIKPDLVAQAIRYIDENYYQPITLDSLAQNWGCSAGYLSKLFKEKMNTSPIHYLGEVRVDKAIKLLLQTDATLQEIAENVGYLDGHTLSRSFKRYKGVSPHGSKPNGRIGTKVKICPYLDENLLFSRKSLSGILVMRLKIIINIKGSGFKYVQKYEDKRNDSVLVSVIIVRGMFKCVEYKWRIANAY